MVLGRSTEALEQLHFLWDGSGLQSEFVGRHRDRTRGRSVQGAEGGRSSHGGHCGSALSRTRGLLLDSGELVVSPLSSIQGAGGGSIGESASDLPLSGKPGWARGKHFANAGPLDPALTESPAALPELRK